jgi:PAS domain S-box-containing protein
MTDLSRKNIVKKSFSLLGDYPKIYRRLTVALVPLIAIFLVVSSHFGIKLSGIHLSLLIYIITILLLMGILSYIKVVKPFFLYFHYTLLFGVMIINLYWYQIDPNLSTYLNFLMAINMIGIALINPKVTVGFYLSTIIIFLVLGVSDAIDFQMLFLIISSAFVITLFNYWRKSLEKNLFQSRKTYQEIFDYSNDQIYVLEENLEIIDFNLSAEKYVNSCGVSKIKGQLFNEIFLAETDDCINNFHNAITESTKTGSAKFHANCSIANKSEYIPKEFFIKKGSYFGKEVWILNVRVIKEQKEYETELIQKKENITRVLENINSFVFNISYDVKDRFRHHVNYVSPKVEDVFGYSLDEYIALVKSERLIDDMDERDRERVDAKFEELILNKGESSWKYRRSVNGEMRWIEEKLIAEAIEGDDSIITLFGIIKDITEDVNSQRKIVESEEQYRKIFEGNLAGVYKTHADGRILDCNPSFAQMLGFEDVEEVKKLLVQDLYYNKEDRLGYLKLLRDKKELRNYPSVLKRKDGRRLQVNNNVSILPDEGGEFNIIIGTVIDMTELKETSIALERSEEKYRLLFEESNNAILLVALVEGESFVVDANLLGSKLLGFSDNNVIGEKLQDLMSSEIDFVSEMKHLENLNMSNEKIEKEWKFKRQDQTEFEAEVSFVTIQLEGEKVVQLVIKDISLRKQNERELSESRLSFKNIVDHSPASILIFTDEKLTYFNQDGEDLFLTRLNAKESVLYKVFNEENHNLIRELIREAEDDIPSYTEIYLGHKDKKKYSINVVVTTYNNKKSNLFLLRDITLQSEYNNQKLRAELAEETNISLQQEIENHKQTQQSLIESTSRIKALFDGSSDHYIFSLDANYKFVSFNNAVIDKVKNSLGKIVKEGDPFSDVFPVAPEARQKIYNLFDKVLRGESAEMVSHFPSKEGEVWIESFLSPITIKDGIVSEISFIAHDITEKIENRKKIALSEENNRAILLAMPDILFKVDKTYVFTDYRASSESNSESFKKFLRKKNIKGEKIKDVISDKDVAEGFKSHIDRAFKLNEVITHNFSFEFNEGDQITRVHYENRYSKMNENEVVIVSRNVTETVEYEKKLIETVREKEVLLKEVHHRVKNNLQVINSILNLQSSYVKDEETLQVILESQNRIRSMSYIHESLYQTKDFSSINFHDYITNLIQNLVHSYDINRNKTKLDLNVEKVELALDQAIPCGLILNELITNSLKYAYPEEEGGEIMISVKEIDGRIEIIVQDSGVGLPEGFKIEDSDSLGLSLVDTLVDQIDGELIIKTKGGTKFLITFEKLEI